MKETFVRDREHFLCILCKERNSFFSYNVFPFLHIIGNLCTYLKLIFKAYVSACRVKLHEQNLHFYIKIKMYLIWGKYFHQV